MVKETMVHFPNGYALNVRKEKISHVGRSIYREFDEQQFVFETFDPTGRMTDRFRFPAKFAPKIKELLETNV